MSKKDKSDTVYICPDCDHQVTMTNGGGRCTNPGCPSNGG